MWWFNAWGKKNTATKSTKQATKLNVFMKDKSWLHKYLDFFRYKKLRHIKPSSISSKFSYAKFINFYCLHVGSMFNRFLPLRPVNIHLSTCFYLSIYQNKRWKMDLPIHWHFNYASQINNKKRVPVYIKSIKIEGLSNLQTPMTWFFYHSVSHFIFISVNVDLFSSRFRINLNKSVYHVWLMSNGDENCWCATTTFFQSHSIQQPIDDCKCWDRA